MKSKHTIIQLLIGLIILLFILLLLGNKSQFSRKLKQAISQGDIIVMSEITNFEWDSLHIIHPYTSSEIIDEQIGFESKLRAPLHDELQLLIFVHQQTIALSIVIDRYLPSGVDFLKGIQEDEMPYTPASAIFEIDSQGNAIPKA